MSSITPWSLINKPAIVGNQNKYNLYNINKTNANVEETGIES